MGRKNKSYPFMEETKGLYLSVGATLKKTRGGFIVKEGKEK